jgi:hypothetical protein
VDIAPAVANNSKQDTEGMRTNRDLLCDIAMLSEMVFDWQIESLS